MSTKPLKIKGVRQTNPMKPLSGKLGRPQGTRARRKFEETRLGFMLKYETPLEYSLIMGAAQSKNPFPAPEIELIEAVCNASDDISFSKSKFKKYLEEYRKNGIHCDRPKLITKRLEHYYSEVRRNKLKAYMSGRRVELKKIINGEH